MHSVFARPRCSVCEWVDQLPPQDGDGEATVNEVEGKLVEGSGKTPNSNRTFSAPQAVLDELAAHLARTGRTSPEELVIQAPGGGPVRATNFRYRVYTPAPLRARLEGLTFHRLRHSPAT